MARALHVALTFAGQLPPPDGIERRSGQRDQLQDSYDRLRELEARAD